MSKVTEQQIQEFIRGYLVAALWSSSDTDPNNENGTVELDQYEWADGEAEKLHQDCRDFMSENEDDLLLYVEHCQYDPSKGTPFDYAGHDFWLTRCGHGTGFWDRGGSGSEWREVGERLSKQCGFGTPYGNIDLTLGDDELVYSNEHPTAYCVQYRNMHDAHHWLAVFDTLARAKHGAEELSQWKSWDQYWKSGGLPVVACIEIDYRSPPPYWYNLENTLHRVRIVNAGNIPDIY